MQVPLVRCRRAVRRTVLVVALVAVCFIVSAHGYSDVVNVGDVESAGSIASDISPPPTTTAPPPPTTPPPTPSPPPPTTTSPPPPTTTRPPPTTTPPPPTTTPPPTTPPPPTTAPPPPTTTPPDAGVPPPTTVPPSTTSPPTTAGPSTTPPAANVTTAPTAKPSTTAPSMAPTSTPGGSGDGLTGGGSADAKSNSGGSSGKNTIIIAVVVIAVVVLLASLYVFRRHRSRKEDSATELQRQLDDHDLELGQSAYISTKAAATDDIIVSDLGASGGTGGNSGNGSRGSYSRPSFPYQKNQQSPASWSSERTTAVSAGDRESLSGLWNDPELLAARIPYEKLHFGELLSRGGFGEVYVGEYHNRRVAIKQLIPDNRKRMAALEDFLKEAALLVPLEHERIVAFVGVAWDSPRDLCIVLEFMPNGDLRNLLAEWRQEGRMMGWADVRKVRIALHVAEALTYLHTLSPKIVHRDLKSKNILLDEQWQAKLSDFGISRTESTHNTMTTNVGSSLWIAPEVMMGSNYNEKADIFSFGIVLTELDSLQLPYYNALTPDGRKMPDAAVLHLVTMGKLQAEFSSMSRKDMMLLGRACLAMDPMQRPTAGEIRFRLSQILGTY